MLPLSRRLLSRQQYRPEQVSPHFLVNGNPPDSPEYLALLWDNFADWHLFIRGG